MSNNFDAIRLAMALLVVWSHAYALHLGTSDREWINRLLGGDYTGGDIAVLGFFTISGFLVSQSYDRSRTRFSYLAKRVRRIYPGYMVATAICAFIVIPRYATHFDLSFARVVRITWHNLLLSDLPPSDAFAMNPDHRVNGSLWTVLFECGCYLGMLLVGSRRRFFLIALLAAVLLTRVGMNFYLTQPAVGATRLAYLLTALLPSFLVGMIAYSYRDQLPRSRSLLIGLLAATLVACRVDGNLANLILVPALGYAIFYVAFSDRIRLHHFGKNGDFSYGTYLYAFPIQQMLQARFGSSIGLASYIAMSFVLSLTAGILSWHLIERYFLSNRRKGPQTVEEEAAEIAPPSHYQPSPVA